MSPNRYAERAGGRAVLYRECDRVTDGNPVFAASGIPGSVGSGSAALWQEILKARRSGRREFRIWPFEVELDEVPDSGAVVVAESYPRACYAVALAPALPSQPLALAKTNPDERHARLRELIDAPWVRERRVELDGLEQAEAGEDDFDALMQAAALVRMVDSRIPLSSHLADPVWEGASWEPVDWLGENRRHRDLDLLKPGRHRPREEVGLDLSGGVRLRGARWCSGQGDQAGTRTWDLHPCIRTGSRR